jgi:multidrug resistance efflux pump
MPAKRNYKVKGTKDFLVLAGIFFFLCLWAIKDAWYPSPKVLEKHPREISVAFSISGAIGQMHVEAGDTVGEDQLLAELRRTRIDQQIDSAKAEYTKAKKTHSLRETAVRNAVKNGATDQGISDMRKNLEEAKVEMDAALKSLTAERSKLEATELLSPTKGEIKEVLVETHGLVQADEAVMKIDPKDHFYLFNKSLAIFSFIAFWVFLGIHILAH